MTQTNLVPLQRKRFGWVMVIISILMFVRSASVFSKCYSGFSWLTAFLVAALTATVAIFQFVRARGMSTGKAAALTILSSVVLIMIAFGVHYFVAFTQCFRFG
ncbi:hypothetical protein HY346_02715 [Candidatus Microgenomates bacterium]|nr:hypothetical protein [Candidatus Microgenomates bacterium]